MDTKPRKATAEQTVTGSDDYEPPELTVLGGIADFTNGVVPTSTDGVLPGSVL